MTVFNPYQVYRNSQAVTATPGDLTLMLYQGAVRYLKQALREMEKKDWGEVNRLLQRVQDIYRELMLTLNPDIALSQSLQPLYDFMIRHLMQANVRKDPAMVQEVLELSEELRRTWEEALKLAKEQRVYQGGLG